MSTTGAGSPVATIPLGTGSISVPRVEGISFTVVQANQLPRLVDPVASAQLAIERPVGTRRLRDLAAGKKSAVIAVTDATRDCPDHLLVPPMLDELHAAGFPDEAITILVAVGTHRASTDAEKRAKLGDAIVDRYRVVDHDAANDDGLATLPEPVDGLIFRINREAMEAGILLSTGRVEPHQYAGFSGGGKTVAIGCASEEVIVATHGPAMLDRPGVRLAELETNPFQEAVRAVARTANVAFVANCVLDDEGEVVAIAYGAPEAVQDELAVTARAIATAPLAHQVDIAIAGVGAPKDANLYQASRAATYLQYAPTPVVRPGGVIILPATCPEGAGEGAGERRFRASMSTGESPGDIVRRIKRDGIRPGEQRAYIVASVLASLTVIVVGMEQPEIARQMGFQTAASIETALESALRIVGAPARAAVVPHALMTLPIVEQITRKRIDDAATRIL
jgi:nickel-dependent lactate racemase